MISIEESRSGPPTARLENNYIHSKYSPLKEAEKFYQINSLVNYNTVVLIEPGFNYISRIIKKYRSSVKIISIHLEKFFFDSRTNGSDHNFLYEDNPAELNTFLDAVLREYDIEGLKVLEWTPATNLFRKETSIINRVISQHVREQYGNITTISGFGKKLFTNSLRNFLFHENIIVPSVSDAPFIITGSGPGLSESIDLLKSRRTFFTLVALPSAVAYLMENNIVPDIVISTDPGFYASMHLNNLPPIPVAAPFSANLNRNILSEGIIPVSQGHFTDSLFFDDNDTFLRLPSNGTVAGSALYLASTLTDGPVFLCGIDFSFVDILSHVRPHSFDSLIDKDSDRIHPMPDLYFKRNIIGSERVEGLRRTTMPLKTYAGWFSSVSGNFNKKCFFLNSHIEPPGDFISANSDDIDNHLNGPASFVFKKYKTASQETRRNFLIGIICKYIESLNGLSEIISNMDSGGEIFPLLNNDLIFNLSLPDLLEFKRHSIDKNGKEVRVKAERIIKKTLGFLDGINV